LQSDSRTWVRRHTPDLLPRFLWSLELALRPVLGGCVRLRLTSAASGAILCKVVVSDAGLRLDGDDATPSHLDSVAVTQKQESQLQVRLELPAEAIA